MTISILVFSTVLRILKAMEAMSKEDYLELGRLYVKEGNYKEALKTLDRAVAKYNEKEEAPARGDKQTLDRLPSELISYYGLCIAYAQNRIEEGVRLCQSAVKQEVLRPDFYLNLGKVYLKADQKNKAIDTFRKGLEIVDDKRSLIQELRRLGLRKKPILNFLPRNNFLNRYLGLLVHRLTQQSSGSSRKSPRRPR
jgi:tetratricopeptide (TPR) repeat protein